MNKVTTQQPPGEEFAVYPTVKRERERESGRERKLSGRDREEVRDTGYNEERILATFSPPPPLLRFTRSPGDYHDNGGREATKNNPGMANTQRERENQGGSYFTVLSPLLQKIHDYCREKNGYENGNVPTPPPPSSSLFCSLSLSAPLKPLKPISQRPSPGQMQFWCTHTSTRGIANP